MGYVPYQVPAEVDEWIVRRAERLNAQRDERVTKVSVLREMVAIVEAAEAMGVKPATLPVSPQVTA
jgi:hypothetical protein